MLNRSLCQLAGFLCVGQLIVGCATDRLQGVHSFEHAMDQCWAKMGSAKGDEELLNQSLNIEIQGYQQVLEELLVSRSKTLKLADTISENIDKEAAMPPELLHTLNINMSRGLDLTGEIGHVVAINECWSKADAEELQKRHLPPVEESAKIKGSMLALSGQLSLYDTYLTTIAVLNEHERIRRFLNQSDLGYGINENQVQAITEAALDKSNVLYVISGIEYYKKAVVTVPSDKRDDEFNYLHQLIQQSPAFAVMQNADFEKFEERVARASGEEVKDNLGELNRRAVNGVSGAFGNLVGLYEERKGKLYENESVNDHILQNLKAGDILLEKTPFRLTDNMIPGHWGHAAIWIGNEEELKNLGIWEHSVVKKYHAQIKEGRGVVEALRDGVTMSTLSHFLNVDDVAILRGRDLSNDQISQIIVEAFRQIGKDYDFNFDVETTDKIVCSELVYMTYTNISWPTDKVVGRYTISPDNVAFKATNNGPLSLVLFYHDGQFVEEGAVELMTELMKNKK